MFSSLKSLSRGNAALRGVLAILLGAICVVWPGISIGVVVALFAIFCFADAIIGFAQVSGSDEGGGARLLGIVIGVLDVVAGLLAIVYPGITAAVLVIVVGVWAIVGGILELGAGWQLSRSGTIWFAVAGLLSIAAGILLVAWPGIGAYSLALVFGIYLLVYGVTLLVAAVATPAGEAVDDFA